MPSLDRTHWLIFAVSAALSLALSPITVIYAALIGPLGLCVTALLRRTRAAAAFAGITAGTLPYLLAALVQGSSA
ncbi:hypothetical protein DPM19_17475 [Actinomadura craniellae]|uniref:Uncharacterized protein n=2 Tax=Actinomadura craniellae TaxID=2231787 RepID=A0A365H4Y6_9ACTN|nr:hypothetical protein DPM19_17475 [Actinomadura craniellae]